MTAPKDKQGNVKKSTPTKRKRRMRSIGALIAAFLIVGVLWFALNPSGPENGFRQKAYSKLTKNRDAKKKEVIEYLENVQHLAKEIKSDPVMLRFFSIMSEDGYKQDDDLEYMFDRHYVSKYGDFYDILLVDADGFVFHSAKKESDYHTNLFEGELADTKLVRHLTKSADEHFVEYEYYSPSEEPAAFFASPLQEGGKHLGWFILQCSINNLNTILTNREGLGRTGELYLVNKEKWMLTDSRFVEDCTTLRLKVDTWAVREALEKGKGTRTIQDYRGVYVLSSFERFDVFGTSWMIICEIDEDEVITDHYRKYAEHYNKRILAYLAQKTPGESRPALLENKRTRVDLNEFAKAEPGERLETYGVATCTAVAVSYPGRFAYLAHIGPEDAIYKERKWYRPFANNAQSDFMSELINRIRRYDIYPFELRNLQFTVVASHDGSFSNAVKSILDSGVGLGNVKLMYNPSAEYANVVAAPEPNIVAVVWSSSRPNIRPMIVDEKDVENLGTIMKRLSGYGA